MPCVCCGREEALSPLPAHMGNLKACFPCIGKHGAENIAQEADRLLAEYYFFQRPAPVCLVCGDPVLEHSDGSCPMWCQECEDRRKRYVNAQAGR